ncbi:hypothetical protein LTR37_017225 [Vermiconidia calcicola]|uniref:Uncharacterized protein n=1 Tax=Vermiconidia calcicola TaxID=1690605 RepID=A0ACC3MM26_9PEZI|nr:hypothetical protein LTR37_017225 [Vermiconidia calcicola]
METINFERPATQPEVHKIIMKIFTTHCPATDLKEELERTLSRSLPDVQWDVTARRFFLNLPLYGRHDGAWKIIGDSTIVDVAASGPRVRELITEAHMAVARRVRLARENPMMKFNSFTTTTGIGVEGTVLDDEPPRYTAEAATTSRPTEDSSSIPGEESDATIEALAMEHTLRVRDRRVGACGRFFHSGRD